MGGDQTKKRGEGMGLATEGAGFSERDWGEVEEREDYHWGG